MTSMQNSLSQAQAALELAVSTRTLVRWRAQGLGPVAYRVGSAVRYRPEDIDAWLERNRMCA